MSTLKLVADVRILKLIDPPMLTLNGSAKPSMLVLGVVTSQTDCGVPGSWFSHAMGLAQVASAGAAEGTTSSGLAMARTTNLETCRGCMSLPPSALGNTVDVSARARQDAHP